MSYPDFPKFFQTVDFLESRDRYITTCWRTTTATQIGRSCSASRSATGWGCTDGEAFMDQLKQERHKMKKEMIAVVGSLCAAPLLAQSFNTTYYAPNGGYVGSSQTTVNGNSTQTTFYSQKGMYGGSAQTSQNGNTVSTSYYNANGLYGGRSQSTTFGNQTTTQHYGANGMPAGRSVTTTFGNQTTTKHYNQYGMPAGSSTQYNNTFKPSRARGF